MTDVQIVDKTVGIRSFNVLHASRDGCPRCAVLYLLQVTAVA